MSGTVMEDSYQISLQNIRHHSQHIHLGIEILFVIRGKVDVMVNQDSLHLAENDLLLINANDVHTVKGHEDNVVLLLQIPLNSIEQLYQIFMCVISTAIHPKRIMGYIFFLIKSVNYWLKF